MTTGAEHIEYLIYLLVCGVVLLTWSYLLGPRRRVGWSINLALGSVLTGYALAVAVGEWWSTLIAKTFVGAVALAAVLTGFVVILFGRTEATFAARDPLGSHIPPVLLRPPWRDRRHHAVLAVATTSLLVVVVMGIIALNATHSEPTEYDEVYGSVEYLCDLPISRTLTDWDERLDPGTADHENWMIPDIANPGFGGTTMYCGTVVHWKDTAEEAAAVSVFAFQLQSDDAEQKFLESVHLSDMETPTIIEDHRWTETVLDRKSDEYEHLILASWHRNLAVVVYLSYTDGDIERDGTEELAFALTQVVYETLWKAA